MRILWLTWKDKAHPLAGGAEVVSSELCKRLAAEGHEVVMLVGGFKGAESEVTSDGVKIVRLGNRYSVYFKARQYVKKKFVNPPELVIEEVNTIPFFSRFYLKGMNRFVFFHQLARQIWFHEMVFPLSVVGYLAEPLYLRLLKQDRVITVSNSTKQDLLRYGFNEDSIRIISEGIQIKPVESLGQIKKFIRPTMLSLGAMRAMKRTLDQVRAFELAKARVPDLQLKIAGDSDSKYGRKVLEAIENSPYRSDIEYLGRVSSQEKQYLLQKSHFITVTSIKEGWGLIVTEAASQGTPAIAYNADGLRDSILHGRTGLISETETPENLAVNIERLLSDPRAYNALQSAAWEWSKHITFENSYKDFKGAIL